MLLGVPSLCQSVKEKMCEISIQLFVLQSFVLQSFVVQIISHLSYNYLSYTSFVLQIIFLHITCHTERRYHHLLSTSFVLHFNCPTIICPTNHLSYTSFVLQIIFYSSIVVQREREPSFVLQFTCTLH